MNMPTADMIVAGADAVLQLDGNASAQEIAIAVYMAMEKERLRTLWHRNIGAIK